MAVYNNELIALTIPSTVAKSDLSYTSVSVKEYPGMGVGGLPNTALSGNTIPRAVVINKTTTMVGVPEVPKIHTAVETKVVNTVVPLASVPIVEPVGLKEVLSRVGSEGMTNLAPMIPKLPAPATAHSHSAYDVYETEKRVWFTPDERLELRGTYEELILLKASLGDLVPSVDRAVVFCIPDVPDTGNLIEIRFPWEGIVKEFEFNYARFDEIVSFTYGPSTTTLNVQRCADGSYVWADLLVDDITLSENVSKVVLPAEISVLKNDMFRLRFSSVSLHIKNLTAQLVIKS